MPKMNRRVFLAASASAGVARVLPQIAARPAGRRVLTLVYDKSLGMMRAIDRVPVVGTAGIKRVINGPMIW